ncbi:MAG: serine protease [Polyangiaceae bacterium]
MKRNVAFFPRALPRTSILALGGIFAGCHGTPGPSTPVTASHANPKTELAACRVHSQFTTSASALAPALARPMTLAGLAGQTEALRSLLESTEEALQKTNPGETEAYRKSLAQARIALEETSKELSHPPEDVKLALKRVMATREAARVFAKGRSDGTDLVLRAAEADIGTRHLDAARATEVAHRLEEAAKIRQGATPLVVHANALRDLAKASANWAGMSRSAETQTSLTTLFQAAASFGDRCQGDGAAVFAGSASAKPEDLRKRAIVIANIPPTSCIDSARRLFPNMPEDGMSGHGTGFVVYRGSEPLLVTNRHVVAGAGKLEAKHADGSPMPPVHLAYVSREHDIAVLSFDKKDPSIGDGMAFAADDPPELSPVIAAGFPGLFGRASFQLTRGHVSNAKLLLPDGARDVVFLQHTAVVDPGSSGGPLVNERGELVGINTRKAVEREAVSFAIPGSIVRTIVSETGERIAKHSAKTACLLAVDALQREPAALDGLVSQDIRTRAPLAKEWVIEALHHGNVSPCDVLKSAAVAAEWTELANTGKPGPLELCESLKEKEGTATATVPLPKGTATLEFREESDGFRVAALRIEKVRR